MIDGKNKLKIIALISYLLLVPMSLYFRYFPLIVNSTFTNVFILVLISAFILLVIYGTFKIDRKNSDFLLVLPQTLLFIFLVTAMPSIRLNFPPYGDSYYYLITTLNILHYGTLNPILNWWYPQISQQLSWPIMEIFTTSLVYLSNINVLQFVRFLLPFIGALFFLVIFILTKTIKNDNRLALLTAFFSSLSASILFYQSEYHPQAFAALIFMFMIYFYFKFKQSNKMIFGILMVITIFIFAASHHFSSLFIGLFALIYLFVIYLISKIGYIKKRFPISMQKLTRDYNLWILIAISMFAYQFFVFPNFILGNLQVITEASPNFTLVTTGVNVPIISTLLNATKYIVFFLTIPSVYIIWKYKDKFINENRVLILFICSIIAGLLGSVAIIIPLDRVIIYAYPFIAFFAALTIIKLYDEKKSKNLLIALLLMLTCIPLIAGVINADLPAFLFKDPQITSYYWFSDNLSSVNNYNNVGAWIKDYSNNSNILQQNLTLDSSCILWRG